MIKTPHTLALLAGLGLAVASVGYTPAAAAAQVFVGVSVHTAPPPPRYARVPPPRPGYLWAPGYWRWNPSTHAHVWGGGYWVRARPGYRYVPERWVNHGPDWRLERGHWVRR